MGSSFRNPDFLRYRPRVTRAARIWPRVEAARIFPFRPGEDARVIWYSPTSEEVSDRKLVTPFERSHRVKWPRS